MFCACFHLECTNSLYDFHSGNVDPFIFVYFSLLTRRVDFMKIKPTFPVSRGLLCLYDKQNNAWLLVDMKFLFSCSTRHLTRSLRSLVSYRLNCSTPKTDQYLISPYNITPESNMKVMRIKEMITN